MIRKGFATQWKKLKKILPISSPNHHQSQNNFSGEPPLRLLCNHCSNTTSSTPVETIFNEMKIAWDKRGSNVKPVTQLHHTSHMRRLTNFALLLHTREQPGSILGPREWLPWRLQVPSIRGPKIQQNFSGWQPHPVVHVHQRLWDRDLLCPQGYDVWNVGVVEPPHTVY